ncbi:hypothetical protein [Roseateles asaccharophilus]|uniref:Lipoprotein n=1 Tax=Roseateles asaccharophilus TaxID=582607 RepID=A0ABU2A5C3_9BURK|nr:hypothetical protein [Roseateles asaccharophilus]MDR7332402.1 hypothetical protein [Roseateles asaccharophilus]
MRIQRIGRPAVVAACALTLAACGGGGDSSSGGEPPLQQQTMLGISASNYQAVGQAVVSSALFLGDSGGLVSGAETSTDARVLRHAVNTAKRGFERGGNRPVLVTGVEIRDTVACAQGGSIAVTVNDANNNGSFDAGDSITMDLLSCKEEGAVSQGRLAISVQAITGVFDSNNYSATMTMTMTAFNVTTGSDSAQGDGALSMTMSQSPSGVGELTLSTARFAFSGRVGGQNFTTTLTDTRLVVRDETVGSAWRSSITYTSTLDSSQFGNKQVTITTPQALVITAGNVYPSSGQLLARGHANSAVRITALNATQARLELDAEGDGSYETQVTKTWAELQ